MTLTLISLILITPASVRSQGACIELNQPGADRLFASPGQVITAGISAANRSTATRTFTAKSLLPAGWRLLTPDQSFALSPGGSNVVLISVVVPSGCGTGPNQIHVIVQDSADNNCRAEQIIVVFVKPTRELSLDIIDSPRFLVSGRPDSITYTVRNRGNEPARIRISTWTTEGLEIVPASFITILGVGESRTLSANVEAAGGLTVPQTHVLRIRAVLQDDSTVEAAASTQFQTIAGAMSAEKRYHEAPLQVTVRAAGEESRTGGQIELSGAGTLTEGGKERYELFLRTPDIQSSSQLAYRDEYRFRYSDEQYEAVLGDRSYVLSPLTEFGRYAFGAGGSAKLGNFSVGGFVNRTRFYTPALAEQALYGGYSLDNRSSVSLNFLHKGGRDESSTGSARALFRPVERNEVDIEYAISTRTGEADHAVAARLVGNQDWLAYDLRYVRAGPDFGGYYADLESKSVSLNIRPWNYLRFDAYAREEKHNLLFDTLVIHAAPLDRIYQAGAGFGETFSLYYRAVEQIDQLSASQYNRKEESLQLRSGISGRSAGVTAIVEFGRSIDRLLTATSPFQRYAIAANVEPVPRQNFSASLEYTSERNLLTWDITERWSGSFSAGLELGAANRVQAGIFGTRTGGTAAETFATADAAIVHTFPFQHTAAFRVRRTYVLPRNEERSLAWLLEYTVPLQIPVTRLTTTGDIRGRVLDAELMRGLADVVVYAGTRAAITDEYGEYAFAGLDPGSYAMRVDQASIGYERVTTSATMTAVSVAGGDEARHDFYVTRGAEVTGSVRVFTYSQAAGPDTTSPSYADSAGMPNVLVELSSETDTLRRLSDNRGQFHFPRVRPGDWIIRLIDLQPPDNHSADKDTAHVTLAPGAREETLFRLLPRARRIRIIQHGKVEVEGAQPLRRTPMQPRRIGTCIISEDSTGRGYIAQVSQWPTLARALDAAELIRRIVGFKATVRTLPNGMNAVMVGPFTTLGEAEDACREIGRQ